MAPACYHTVEPALKGRDQTLVATSEISLASLGQAIIRLADEVEHALAMGRPSNVLSGELTRVEESLCAAFEMPEGEEHTRLVRFRNSELRGECRWLREPGCFETRWYDEAGQTINMRRHKEPIDYRRYPRCPAHALTSRLSDLDDLLLSVSLWVNTDVAKSVGYTRDSAQLQSCERPLRTIGEWLCSDQTRTELVDDSENEAVASPLNVFYPAGWYSKATDSGLYPDLLGKAYREKRIMGRKSGHRNQYELSSVIASYPQYRVLLEQAHGENANEDVPTRTGANDSASGG